MSRRKTKEELNTQLEEQGRSLRLIGEYTAALKKALFRCDDGHECMMRPNDILNGHGCAMCAGHHKTREQFNETLIKNGRTERMIGEYLGTLTKTLFRCEEGHEWMVRPNDIDNDRGCPLCAQFGFDTSSSAHTYILLFDDFIKYGITNDLKRRLREHRRNGNFTLIETRYYESGYDALEWEREVRRTHGGNYISKERCPDGFTETLPTEKLNELVQTCLTHLTQRDTMIT
jgi:hypothetical protein